MEAIVIIPARMAATRFPGKPLAKISGISMIGHCYLRAAMSTLAKEIYVATCDSEIADEINRLGGKAIMTSTRHERASDRTAEALCILESEYSKKPDVIVMLQGDEPLIHPECIDSLIKNHIQFPDTPVFNLTQHIGTEEEFHSENTVKVLTNLQSEILVFSREPIPSPRINGLRGFKPKKQLGIISFRRESLLDFYELPTTSIEKIESIDMLRFLEYGRKIKEVLTDKILQSVDIPSDIQKVVVHMEVDPLYETYKHLKDDDL